ncbi:MAG TPA: hypothetical protein PKB10_05185 [Tepidisphaeraceae bacterium]|nr:hypothetical protein [Tepidisphaeraceae bacterium]
MRVVSLEEGSVRALELQKDLDARRDEAGVLDVMAGLLGASRQTGYLQGYRDARQEQLEALVHVAERYLQRSGSAQTARPIVYGFIEQLQQQLRRAQDADLGLDGSGI